MARSLRTHEKIVNKFCPCCGTNKGHKLVESPWPFWVHLINLCTMGIGYLFTGKNKWAKMCSSCGTIN